MHSLLHSLTKGKVVTGIAVAVIVGGTAAAAAHVYRHKAASVIKYHRAVVVAQAQPQKTCWRYYGGPKGGMWPGPCP
jgi:hypothetical protein